jgi:hydrogenase maturation protease
LIPVAGSAKVGSVKEKPRAREARTSSVEAPLLVLGVGNALLSDDAAGLVMLEQLARDAGNDDAVEYLDGGTQGLALLGRLSGRKAVVLLDAVALGSPPGTVHVLRFPFPHPIPRATTAHEGSGAELLRFAALLGELPEQTWIIGIEAGSVRTGIGLSTSVMAAMPRAVTAARGLISNLKQEHCNVPGDSR